MEEQTPSQPLHPQPCWVGLRFSGVLPVGGEVNDLHERLDYAKAKQKGCQDELRNGTNYTIQVYLHGRLETLHNEIQELEKLLSQ